MFIALAGLMIESTEEGPSNTPGGDVVVRCIREADDVFSWPWHGSRLRQFEDYDELCLSADGLGMCLSSVSPD